MRKLSQYFIASPANNYHPWALGYKAFILYGIILLLIRLLLASPTAGQASAVDSETLMQQINAERRARNLTTLVFHNSLFNAALSKSQDMIDRDYFAHIDPDGNYVWGKITAAGYGPYRILGENLAIDFATSEGMVKAWIDSPTHRANLLHPQFVHQGLAALYGDYQGRYTNLTASLFGTPARRASSQAAPQKNTKPKTITAKPAPQTKAEVIENQNPTSTLENSTEQEVTIPAFDSTPQESVPIPTPIEQTRTPLQLSRLIFSIFAGILLVILAIDSIIIHRHEVQIGRSHSSYHFLALAAFLLVLGLIWWW